MFIHFACYPSSVKRGKIISYLSGWFAYVVSTPGKVGQFFMAINLERTLLSHAIFEGTYIYLN